MLKRMIRVLPSAAILVVFCLLSPVSVSSVWADDNHMFPMLRMGVDARALAMGGAYVAETKDASAGYWNPAGLGEIEDGKHSINLMGALSEKYDRRFFFFGYGYNWTEKFSFGFSLLYAGTTDIMGYDQSGLPQGTFDDINYVFSLSLGKKFEKISFGITPLKAVVQKIDDESETIFSCDFGLKFFPHEKVKAGVMIRDLAGKEVDGLKIPTHVEVGAAIHPLEACNLTLPVSVEKTLHKEGMVLRMGGEYNYKLEEHAFSVRVGLNNGDFTGGCGYGWVSESFSVKLDYAYMIGKEDFLGDPQRISLTFGF